MEQNQQLRLKSIKLAGFKSFVDPTTVSLPSNLTSVVGPNGCGKSNIIDAVRWVMGESSAKNLRGESMADVIFNGSTGRKPVGQASIDLVFDNPNGAIGGEYAGYAEIAIRRLVTRDGQSQYFLNGTRCRRRDIVDIFLGTGLGPRSYAIIGQGTISRVIEAKPEELRVYIEEAAGISKYKERRRETENRMRHTRENLERLTDLRDELEKQLNHLQRQARSAEKYKEYKQEERTYKAQLLALRWQSLATQVAEQETAIREQEVRLEAAVAALRKADAEIETLRELHNEHSEQVNAVQARYYEIGSQVSRYEQTLQHQRERSQQLRDDLRQVQQSLLDGERHLSSDGERIVFLEQELATIEPRLEQAQQRAEVSQETLFSAEEEMQDWQQSWDDFNRQAANASQTAQVQQTRIQHLEQSITKAQQIIERLQGEQQRWDLTALRAEISELQEQVAALEAEHEERQAQAEAAAQQIQHWREQQRQCRQQLDEQRQSLQRLIGRRASLEALQQAALGQQDKSAMQWLEQQQLQAQPRLGQQLQVEAGWEVAVETALSHYLQAVCVTDFADYAEACAALNKGSMALVSQAASEPQDRPVTAHLPTLLSKVSSAYPLAGMLDGIYVADDLGSALQLRSQLAQHESIITRDGLWLSQNWLRVSREQDAQAGVIQREREVQQLDADINQHEQAIAQLEAQQQEVMEGLQQAEEQRESGQRLVADASRQLSDIRSQLRVKEGRLQQIEARNEQLAQELTEQRNHLQTADSDLTAARHLWQEAMTAMEEHADKREQLESQRDDLREKLSLAKQQARELDDVMHELSLQHKTLHTELTGKRQHLQRTEQQVAEFVQRKEHLEQGIDGAEEPLHELALQLEESLEQRLAVEEELTEVRSQLQQVDQKLRELERNRQQYEQHSQQVRDNAEKVKLAAQGLQVRRATVQEQLQEDEHDVQQLLQTMPEQANEAEWEQHIATLEQRIARLGAINLAAIEEYAQQAERKEYLDQQNDDLVKALTTLEDAIRKIDRETRQRFKDTYDTVDQHFRALFPKVFGGGSAYLELTGDDLLDTGVTVMARPPGKRNSTIHLLSGGEKALTAVALVFSIFQITPAPFCMLDEVDAPLDDANVVRYCNLLKEMSQKVQFIFISHNKVAIEMAEHLVGVTMKEPGVSRLVSVDMEEAMAMAEA